MESWGDSTVLITLQISPCSACFHFTPDSFYICCAFGFFNPAVIEKPWNQLKIETWQDEPFSPSSTAEEQELCCPVSAHAGIPRPHSPFRLCHGSPLPFPSSPSTQGTARSILPTAKLSCILQSPLTMAAGVGLTSGSRKMLQPGFFRS